MNKRMIILFILIGVVVVVTIIFFYQPKSERSPNKEFVPLTWDPGYEYDSKEPYGAYMFYELLRHSVMHFENVKGKPGKKLKEYSEDAENALLVVYASAYPEEGEEWDKIDEFVGSGNYALFILEEDPARLADFYEGILKISGFSDSICNLRFYKEKTQYTFDRFINFKHTLHYWKHFIAADTVTIYSDTASRIPGKFLYHGNDYNYTFIVHEVNEEGKPVFIEIPYGDGSVFIHRTPIAFSNISLIEEKNVRHAEKVLSVIPYKTILYNIPSIEDEKPRVSPLQFILSEPSLTWAYYLILGGLLLFVLFNLKRKQRAIPLLPPKTDSMVEFADALAKIYHQKHDNTNLVRHQFRNFTTFIRTHYHLSPMNDKKEYARLIAIKSGLTQASVESLLVMFDACMKTQNTSDDQLISLHNVLDNFYKNCK